MLDFLDMKKSQTNILAVVILIGCGVAFHRGGWTLIDFRPAPSYISTQPINTSYDPVQETYPDNVEEPIIRTIGGRQTLIIPKASYKIAGRVVSRRHYHMDWHSKLSPVDLAMSWGPMASKEIDKYVSYKHTDRYYHYSYSGDFPLEPSVILRHTANEHLIPANNRIEKTIRSIKVDEVVELEGYLVNIEGYDQEHEIMVMKSSLTREDTGPGACEIMYVTKVRIGNGVFR